NCMTFSPLTRAVPLGRTSAMVTVRSPLSELVCPASPPPLNDEEPPELRTLGLNEKGPALGGVSEMLRWRAMVPLADLLGVVRTLAEIKRSVAGRGVEDRAVGRRGRGLWRWRQRGGEAGGLLGSAGGQREREGGAERGLADHGRPHRVWLALRSMSSTAEIIFE